MAQTVLNNLRLARRQNSSANKPNHWLRFSAFRSQRASVKRITDSEFGPQALILCAIDFRSYNFNGQSLHNEVGPALFRLKTLRFLSEGF
jgi:hypothetical protein